MELLSVLGILALVLAIVGPTLGVALESSRRTACASNLRQLYLGFAAYGADHGGHLPNQYLTCHDLYHRFGTHRLLVPHMLPARLDGQDRLWEYLQQCGHGIVADTVRCPSRPVFYQHPDSSGTMSWAGGVVTSYTFGYGLRPSPSASVYWTSTPVSLPSSPMRLTDDPRWVLVTDTVASRCCAEGYRDTSPVPLTANHRVNEYAGTFAGGWHLRLGGSADWQDRAAYPARFANGVRGSSCNGATGTATVCHSPCPWDISWWWVTP